MTDTTATRTAAGTMRFLSIADIADILGVPLSTVYKWSSAGGDRFPRHIRHGKHVRVRTDWFQQWIDGMVEGGGHDN